MKKKIMVVDAKWLIEDLILRTQQTRKEALEFQQLDEATLNARLGENSWSVLECMEHLNLYGDFYLPEIETRIRESKRPFVDQFKAGILGNYLAKSMLPKKGMSTMKTFKSKNPIRSSLDLKCINRFIEQQEEMLQLLERSRGVDLNKTQISTTLWKYLKINLGDGFRFVIYHNQRHLDQAQRVLAHFKGQ